MCVCLYIYSCVHLCFFLYQGMHINWLLTFPRTHFTAACFLDYFSSFFKVTSPSKDHPGRRHHIRSTLTGHNNFQHAPIFAWCVIVVVTAGVLMWCDPGLCLLSFVEYIRLALQHVLIGRAGIFFCHVQHTRDKATKQEMTKMLQHQKYLLYHNPIWQLTH